MLCCSSLVLRCLPSSSILNFCCKRQCSAVALQGDIFADPFYEFQDDQLGALEDEEEDFTPVVRRISKNQYPSLNSPKLSEQLLSLLGDVRQRTETTFAVCNPADGKLPQMLLDSGAKRILILERTEEHFNSWKRFVNSNRNYPGVQMLEAHKFNVNSWFRYAAEDLTKNQDTLPTTFANLVKKDQWTPSDPSLCLLGILYPPNDRTVLKHLMRRRLLFDDVFQFGPVEMFVYVGAVAAAAYREDSEFTAARCTHDYQSLWGRAYSHMLRLLFERKRYLPAEPIPLPKAQFDRMRRKKYILGNVKSLQVAESYMNLDRFSLYLLHLRSKHLLDVFETLDDGTVSFYDLCQLLWRLTHINQTTTMRKVWMEIFQDESYVDDIHNLLSQKYPSYFEKRTLRGLLKRYDLNAEYTEYLRSIIEMDPQRYLDSLLHQDAEQSATMFRLMLFLSNKEESKSSKKRRR